MHSTPANPVEAVMRRAGFVASQASFALTLSGLDGGRTAVPGACAERGSLLRGRPWKQDRRAGDPWPRTHEFGSPEASLQASACKKKESKDKKRKREEDEETQLDMLERSSSPAMKQSWTENDFDELREEGFR
ncbi:uncharacterized protein LOC129137936 isoform X1 [Pan troglodytes]|uniref:uncharacterized protein LOC129137936 isoform X1 n=1 Tax=Pan troglodytes TaxID=9598 RepID=UPI0030133F6B